MKLIQYQDMPEGGAIASGCLIALGDITQYRTGKVLEHYVAINLPLPAFGWRSCWDRDRVEYGRLWLRIFHAWGIAPLGRWRFATAILRPLMWTSGISLANALDVVRAGRL